MKMRSLSMSRSCLFVVARMILVVAAARMSASAQEHIRLPASTSEEIDAFGLVPGAASDFMSFHGAHCRVFWDDNLDTPRYVSPSQPLDLGEPPRADGEGAGTFQARIELAVRRFVDEYREFFGISSESLGAPLFSAIGDELLLLSYRQFAGTLPIRGSSFRVLVGSDGRLHSVKSFLLRDAPSVTPPSGSPESIRNRILSEVKFDLELGAIEAQLAFSSGDPRDTRAIWSVQIEKESAYPGEIVADLETNELMQEREYVYYFDEMMVDVVGYYPNPDEDHPNFFYQTPEDFGSEAYPIEDVMILTGADVTFTDDSGVATVVRSTPDNSTFDWVLASGQCINAREQILDDGRRVLLCEQLGEDFDDFVDFRTEMLEDGTTCTARRVLMKRVPNAGGGGNRFGVTMNQNKTFAESARLMAFRHINRFSRHVDQRVSRFDVEADDVGKLRVNVLFDQFPRLLYFPSDAGESRLCVGWYLYADENLRPGELPAQRLTPTLLAHEFAHHSLYRMTRYRDSQYFDCFNADFCNWPNNDDHDDGDPDIELSIFEGITDAFATYYTDTSKFGYYARGRIRAPHSFDVADPAERHDDTVRAIVAKVLWEVREAIIAQALAQDGDPEILRDVGKEQAESFLYEWVATHRLEGPEQRAFDLGSLRAELLDSLRETLPDVALSAAIHSALGHHSVLRGDSNLDGRVGLSDAVQTLGFLFVGATETCETMMDADASGTVDLSDAVWTLNYLFTGGDPIRGSYPDCEWAICDAGRDTCLD